MMLPKTDVSIDYIRRRSVLRALKSMSLERLFHAFSRTQPSNAGARQEQEHKMPLLQRYAETRRATLDFFVSEFKNALSGHPDYAATQPEHAELAALRGELEVVRSGKKEPWGFEAALTARATYHERLRNGGRARAPLAGDAALNVPQLRAALMKLGVRLGSGYVKKKELLTRLKAAQARSGSLLVPRVRRQTPAAAAAAAATATAKTAMKKKEKKTKAQQPAGGAKQRSKKSQSS